MVRSAGDGFNVLRVIRNECHGQSGRPGSRATHGSVTGGSRPWAFEFPFGNTASWGQLAVRPRHVPTATPSWSDHVAVGTY